MSEIKTRIYKKVVLINLIYNSNCNQGLEDRVKTYSSAAGV